MLTPSVFDQAKEDARRYSQPPGIKPIAAAVIAALAAATIISVLGLSSKPEHELIEDVLTAICAAGVAFCGIFLYIRQLHQRYWKDVQRELIIRKREAAALVLPVSEKAVPKKVKSERAGDPDGKGRCRVSLDHEL